MESYFIQKSKSFTPIFLLDKAALQEWLAGQDARVQAWVSASGFKAKDGSTLLIPNPDGALSAVLHGVTQPLTLWSAAGLPGSLPEGVYGFAGDYDTATLEALSLGWLLGCYDFARYKKETKPFASLAVAAGIHSDWVMQQAQAIQLVRDLINTPAEDMGPSQLADAAHELAETYDARFRVIIGDELLSKNYPMIHAVGRASDDAPRLIDISWGEEDAPKVTLVGKGVCFDSGGLDLKPADNMLLMKKDMGGAAHVLGLAQLVMASGLRVRLRVLIPAVENSVAGNAFRPKDILNTRKGITVEVGNTDAEGRLVLGDALTEADSEQPELIIDCATLTGAARVALGTEVPAIFSNDSALAEQLQRLSMQVHDPLWQLPLWNDYRRHLDSKIADINNIGGGGFGGAITAALFLKEFVTECPQWIHMDVMAWNQSARPGRPEGGEAMGMRALFALLLERFG